MSHILCRVFATLALICLSAIATAQTLPTTTTVAQSGSEVSATESNGQQDLPSEFQALVDVLKDDAARQILIDALSEAATQTTPSSDADGAATDNPVTLPTLSQQELQSVAQSAAEVTATFANNVRDRVEDLWDDVEQLTEIPRVLSDAKRARIIAEAPMLLLTVVATVAIYRMLRILARVVVPRPKDRTMQSVAVSLTLQALLRALGLLTAWVAGYGMAWTFGGGSVALVQAYYLNAFLVAGAFTFALGLFVSHSPKDVTFSSLPADIDATIFRSVKRVAALLIYTVVAVVPISRIWTNLTISASLRSVLLTVALIMAIFAIRRIKHAIHEWLNAQHAQEEAERRASTTADEDEFSNFVATKTEQLWNRVWPPMGMLYVVVCYWIAITKPYNMLDILGRATAHSLGAVALLLLSLRLLTGSSSIQIPMKQPAGRFLALFIERLNGFLPTLAVLAGVVGFIASLFWGITAWSVFSLDIFLSEDIVWGLGTALLIILLALFVWAGISAWIDDRLSNAIPGRAVSSRTRTLLSLARNAFTIIIFVFGGMMALAELGINIAPLIAGAGVIGLAIGFGAQKLVQDIITGVFIQLENAFNEGDVVTVAGITGSVESLTIRSVGIRDLSGVYHLVPFSAVDTVSNFMRRFSYHVEVAGISYDSDIDEARAAMQEAFKIVKDSAFGHLIIGDLEMHGVVALNDSSVDIRARIRTLPGKQWDVGRAYTEQIKKVFDKHGIEIPFPHRELKMPSEFFDRMGDLAQPSAPKIVQDAAASRAVSPKPLGSEAGPMRNEGPDTDED